LQSADHDRLVPIHSAVCESLWFAADDADTLHRALADASAPIVAPPADGPFGRFFMFRDPDGYAITVHTAGSPQHDKAK
jgi:predicted enzyme related to lactoylglutathione lyase